MIDVLYAVAGAALCVLAVAGWWWEAHGRRAWERDLARRERAEHLARMKKPRSGRGG